MSTAVPITERIAIARQPFAWQLEPDEHGRRFDLLLATDRETRDRAYRLACQVYQAHGYARPGLERLVWPYDAEPTTLTVLIVDGDGLPVATATLVYDGDGGLPCDRLFPAEMACLRERGRRVLEV